MKRKVRPYSRRHALAIGLLTATAFALLSLFLLYAQVRGAHQRLAGEVVQVEDDHLTIRNARGIVTRLTISDDVELRGVTSADSVRVGQHLMTRGHFRDDGTFEVERMKVFDGEPTL